MDFKKFVVARGCEQKREFTKMTNFSHHAVYCSCKTKKCVCGGFRPDDEQDSIVLFPECIIRSSKVPKNKRQLQNDVAGQKVLQLLLLNACEKQREETSNLKNTLAELDFEEFAAKRKLEFFTSLVRFEQNQNDDFTKQVESNMFECDRIWCACQRLTSSISNTKADIALIDQYLAAKNSDVATFKKEVGQVMLDLCNTKAQNEELQAAMDVEKREVKSLEEQIDKLLHDIRDAAHANRQLEIEYDKEFESKTAELEQAGDYIGQLQVNQKPLEVCAQTAEVNSKYAEKLKCEEQVLRDKIAFLQSQINKPLVRHFRPDFKTITPYAKISVLKLIEVLKDIFPALMMGELVALLFIVY